MRGEPVLGQRALRAELREAHRHAAADRHAGPKPDFALTNSRSSSAPAGIHEVTCAPSRWTRTFAPSPAATVTSEDDPPSTLMGRPA
jgi:hypothetical protein